MGFGFGRMAALSVFAVVILSVLIYFWLHQPTPDLGQLPTI